MSAHTMNQGVPEDREEPFADRESCAHDEDAGVEARARGLVGETPDGQVERGG
jgi:hypothetical protein